MKLKIFLIAFFLFLFAPLVFRNYIAAPMDTLTGAYFPWLAYKWGYVVGVPVKNALLSDVYDTFFIWKHQGLQQLFSGRIPGWDPYEFLGTPLLATFHSALLHPANIFFLLPLPWGWNGYIIGSTIAAFICMYLFLRSYRFAALPSAIGGLMFCLGGPMMTWSEFGTAVWAMAMLPLLLFFIHTGRLKYIPAFLTALILAGNVQIVTYAGIIIPLYTFLNTSINKTVKVAFLCALGLTLSAIQLLPTASFYPLTIRGAEKYASLFGFGLQPVSQLVRLITPDIFGHPVTANYSSAFSYHEYSGYFTAIAIALCLVSATQWVRGRRLPGQGFFLCLMSASIFLAVDSPVSRWLFSLPLPLLTYSSASRILFVTVFAGAFLAAQQLSQRKLPRKLILLVCTLLIAAIGLQLSHFAPERLLIGIKNSLLPLGSLAILTIAAFLPLRLRHWILLLTVAISLGYFYIKYNPFLPSRLIYPQTESIRFLQTHPDFAAVSLSENTLPPNTWAWYKIRSFAGYNPLHLESFNRFAQVANSQKYANSPSRYVKISQPNFSLLRLSNVGYYVIAQEEDSNFAARKNLQLVYTGEGVNIYADPAAKLDRYILPRYQLVSTQADLAAALESPDFDPNTALIPRALPNRQRVEVIAQAYAPGWTARAGNTRLEAFPVFGALLGVGLPADTSLNDVRVTYNPPGLIAGSAISFLGLTFYVLYLHRLSSKYRQNKV